MNYTDYNFTLNDNGSNNTNIIHNNEIAFGLAFGIPFGYLLLNFYAVYSCHTESQNRRKTCLQLTCSLICQVIVDISKLIILCQGPDRDDYYNERQDGACDKCICCKKKKKKEIKLTHLVEIVVTQPFDKNETCVICCDELGSKKHGQLKCGHKFHKKCIEQWMEVSAHKDCPICRR